MWVIFVALCVMIAFVTIGRLREAKEIIPWRTDFRASKAEAKESGKPMLLYFTASWCVPCQNLKRTTWANAKVDAALRDYVPVKIDVDDQAIIAKTFEVEVMPSYVILSPTGIQLAATDGAMQPDDFLEWLASTRKQPTSR